MRILVNDYAGHPFQLQLSRSLARDGHTVLHTYFGAYQTPKGRTEDVYKRQADAIHSHGLRIALLPRRWRVIRDEVYPRTHEPHTSFFRTPLHKGIDGRHQAGSA